MYIKIKLKYVERVFLLSTLSNFLYIGDFYVQVIYAIYSHENEYNEAYGIRIACKCSHTSPFCLMCRDFNGEFNAATVEVIMDVKADYIKNNFDKFIKKSQKRETNNP